MREPIHDFDAIGRSCLILGGVFFLAGLGGVFGHDIRDDLRAFEAAGMPLPAWLPMSLFDHYRLLCAVQLVPNGLMALVGWGLLNRKPWSPGGLKLTAWVFLAGTVASVAWLAGATGPLGSAWQSMGPAVRTIIAWTIAVTTALTVGSIAWLLWRLRGARIG